ncbi:MULTISPECIES: SDR family oxidoreductase [unclassified Pseudomonas]|nr:MULTISPECIES: SDR family oxidoreductase [unclassified Pseudomonas]NWC96803.1 SDR family oxidoreductase [Pseudomonas sp. IPO3779]NWD21214.1 SDR family oxidoreductase [Pseudomonas sp. IPO3778]
MSLSKRIALVTGANKGIGLRLVEKLADAGLKVYLASRDAERGRLALDSLRQGERDIRMLGLDVTDEASLHQAAAYLTETEGRLDILVNNAGAALDRASPTEANLKLLRATFEVNVFGVIATTQVFMPLLRQSALPVIVNVSSDMGSLGLHSNPAFEFFKFNSLAYNASKTALNAFTVMLAKELKEQGFKVNSVNPGFTATDLNGYRGYGTVDEAASTLFKYAMLDASGPTGGYFDRNGTLPW